MYKRRRSHDFLARFTELNYRLKYVEGAGVMTFAKAPTKAAPAAAATTSKKSVDAAPDAKQEAVAAPSAVATAAAASGRPARKRASPARSSSPP